MLLMFMQKLFYKNMNKSNHTEVLLCLNFNIIVKNYEIIVIASIAIIYNNLNH